MRILALSTAYAAGILFSLFVLALDTFLLRGLWLPVAFAIAATLLCWRFLSYQKPWYPSLALLFGMPGFWSFGLADDVLMRFPVLGWTLSLGFSGVSLFFLLLTFREARPGARELVLTILLAFVVAFFSGNTGRAGPMLQWLRSLGLDGEQAELATVIFRKTVHFCGYAFVSSIAALAGLRSNAQKRGILFGLTFALLLASFDEMRQAASFHRGGSIWDVFLDLCGILFGLFLVTRGRSVREKSGRSQEAVGQG